MVATVESPAFSEADVIQSVCRESFQDFVREFWDDVVKEPLVWNWHMEYLCQELQRVAERVIARQKLDKNLLVNIPPGTSKSTICSIMFHAWVWTRMPEARFITASYEERLALGFATKARALITGEKYQAVFKFKETEVEHLDRVTGTMKTVKLWRPSTESDAKSITLEDDQNTKGLYQNTFGGDRKSVGSEGTVTGSHGHFIMVDDPLNPKEAVSVAGLRAVNYWMDETLPSRKVDKEIAVTILIMQRLHEDDPTGHWIEKQADKIKWVCLPARSDEGYEVRPAKLRLRYVNGMLDPYRLSHDALESQRQLLGSFGYAAQYGQSPVPRGGGTFLIDKFILDQPLPALVDFVARLRYWDKASTKGGGAYTVGAELGFDKFGRWWIIDILRGQWDSGTRERLILSTAQNDGQSVVISTEQEPGSGGKESAQNTVFNLAGFSVRVDRPVGDKVLRADPFSVQVNNGNVYIPKGAPWWKEARNEFQFFPFSKYKDQVDACSACFTMLATGKHNPRGKLL